MSLPSRVYWPEGAHGAVSGGVARHFVLCAKCELAEPATSRTAVTTVVVTLYTSRCRYCGHFHRMLQEAP